MVFDSVPETLAIPAGNKQSAIMIKILRLIIAWFDVGQMEGLCGFEGKQTVMVVVLGTNHFKVGHHGFRMVGAVPVKGHRDTVFDRIVGMVFDFRTSHLLLPECDPDLTLSVKRDGVPEFMRRVNHVGKFGRNVGFEEVEDSRPAFTLDKDDI